MPDIITIENTSNKRVSVWWDNREMVCRPHTRIEIPFCILHRFIEYPGIRRISHRNVATYDNELNETTELEEAVTVTEFVPVDEQVLGIHDELTARSFAREDSYFLSRANKRNVGIILSTYNRPEMLEEAIASVLAQDYKSWILYLCDDASDKATQKICESYVAKYPKQIRYIRNKENWGNVTRGRNTAILFGECKYYVFMDDDNTMKPARLSEQVAFTIYNPEVGFTWCQCEGIIEGQVSNILRQNAPKEYDAEMLDRGNYIDSNEIMVKAQVFEQIGMFDERLDCMEDWDFVRRAAKRFPIKHLEKPLINYRIHKDNRVNKMTGKTYKSSTLLRAKRLGEKYKVILVKPPEETFAHSHNQVFSFIRSTLEKMGWIDFMMSKSSTVIDDVYNFQPNLVVYLYPGMHPEETLVKDVETLGLCIEEPWGHHRTKLKAKYLKWIATNERNCMTLYPENNVILVPTLSASDKHSGRTDLGKKTDIVIVGYPYPERVKAAHALKPLIAEGVQVTLIGNRWNEGDNAPSGAQVIPHNIEADEYALWCSNAKITLCVNRTSGQSVSNGIIPVTPARGFVEAYAGGCVVIDNTRADLPLYFEPRKEIEIYKDTEDMVKKIRLLLKQPKRIENIKNAAKKRARQYTYYERMKRLFMLTQSYRKDEEIP